MKEHYLALKERGKHTNQAYIALGNRMIRLGFAMIRNQSLYRPDSQKYVLYDELKKKLRKPNIKIFYDQYVSTQTTA